MNGFVLFLFFQQKLKNTSVDFSDLLDAVVSLSIAVDILKVGMFTCVLFVNMNEFNVIADSVYTYLKQCNPIHTIARVYRVFYEFD